MKCQSFFSWKIVLEIPEVSLSCSNLDKLFNIRTGNTFLKGIGGLASHSFSPEVLDPTNVFHNALNKVKDLTLFKGRRFPYVNFDEQQLNVNIHRFGSNIVIVTIQLKKPIESEDLEILELQKISNHPDIHNVAKNICGLILSHDAKNFCPVTSTKVYPCVQTIIMGQGNWISDSQAVEIITRHKEPNQNIVDKVIAKNAEHQLDSSSILLDRQGLFYRIPERLVRSKSVKKKYLGSCNILEYAIALSMIFEKGYFDNLDNAEKNFIKHLIIEPDVVFLHSVTSKETWKLLIIEFQLENLLLKEEQKANAVSSNKKQGFWFSLVRTPTESKRFVFFSLFLAGLGWLFQQSVYYEKSSKFFSGPEIVIIQPVDQERIEPINGSVVVNWQPIEDADKYIVVINVLESGKWVLPTIDHRVVVHDTKAEIRVASQSSYQFTIQALDSNGDLIAKSDESFFDVSSEQVIKGSQDNQ